MWKTSTKKAFLLGSTLDPKASQCCLFLTSLLQAPQMRRTWSYASRETLWTPTCTTSPLSCQSQSRLSSAQSLTSKTPWLEKLLRSLFCSIQQTTKEDLLSQQLLKTGVPSPKKLAASLNSTLRRPRQQPSRNESLLGSSRTWCSYLWSALSSSWQRTLRFLASSLIW